MARILGTQGLIRKFGWGEGKVWGLGSVEGLPSHREEVWPLKTNFSTEIACFVNSERYF